MLLLAFSTMCVYDRYICQVHRFLQAQRNSAASNTDTKIFIICSALERVQSSHGSLSPLSKFRLVWCLLLNCDEVCLRNEILRSDPMNGPLLDLFQISRDVFVGVIYALDLQLEVIGLISHLPLTVVEKIMDIVLELKFIVVRDEPLILFRTLAVYIGGALVRFSDYCLQSVEQCDNLLKKFTTNFISSFRDLSSKNNSFRVLRVALSLFALLTILKGKREVENILRLEIFDDIPHEFKPIPINSCASESINSLIDLSISLIKEVSVDDWVEALKLPTFLFQNDAWIRFSFCDDDDVSFPSNLQYLTAHYAFECNQLHNSKELMNVCGEFSKKYDKRIELHLDASSIDDIVDKIKNDNGACSWKLQAYIDYLMTQHFNKVWTNPDVLLVLSAHINILSEYTNLIYETACKFDDNVLATDQVALKTLFSCLAVKSTKFQRNLLSEHIGRFGVKQHILRIHDDSFKNSITNMLNRCVFSDGDVDDLLLLALQHPDYIVDAILQQAYANKGKIGAFVKLLGQLQVICKFCERQGEPTLLLTKLIRDFKNLDFTQCIRNCIVELILEVIVSDIFGEVFAFKIFMEFSKDINSMLSTCNCEGTSMLDEYLIVILKIMLIPDDIQEKMSLLQIYTRVLLSLVTLRSFSYITYYKRLDWILDIIYKLTEAACVSWLAYELKGSSYSGYFPDSKSNVAFVDKLFEDKLHARYFGGVTHASGNVNADISVLCISKSLLRLTLREWKILLEDMLSNVSSIIYLERVDKFLKSVFLAISVSHRYFADSSVQAVEYLEQCAGSVMNDILSSKDNSNQILLDLWILICSLVYKLSLINVASPNLNLTLIQTFTKLLAECTRDSEQIGRSLFFSKILAVVLALPRSTQVCELCLKKLQRVTLTE